MRTYVGIDFSLNSPAFCIERGGDFVWGSITRSERTLESLSKNADKPYSILSSLNEFKILILEKASLPDEYSLQEREKISYYSSLADTFWHLVNVNQDDDIYVAMEGLSFMSAGNSLIDISMATALIRKKIIDEIGKDRFFVFPPTAIKKFAGKGNFKKHEMYDSLVASGRTKEFCELLEQNRNNWITEKLQINKPIDDLVDATWITIFLKDTLEGNLPKIETKKKKQIKKDTN
jgi:hypothetical protein